LSIQFEVNRTFHVPKQAAYSALIDLESAKHWMQGLVSIERVDEGPLKEGSEWKETRKMYGKEAAEYFEVVKLEEHDRIMLRCDGTKGTTGKGEFLFTYILSETGEGTNVTMLGEIRGLTGLSKLFGKVMAGAFKKACAKDLDSLKKHLENVSATTS
jgi:carbon monoxide dehydrogenase subunit G